MLHERNHVRENLDDDVFASNDVAVALPKYRMHDHEHEPHHVRQVIVDELMLDGNSRQNLATFCQTWLEPEVREIMALTLDKNMIDKDEYPQTAELESRCVHMLADLWNAPDAANTLGTSTTGSSEAAMLGGLALLWKWRARRRAAGQPTDRPNLICGPVQICWHKFARYWDVECREIPMEADRMLMTPEEVVSRVDGNTIGVVPTLGVTFTCQYEPVAAVAAALDRLCSDTGTGRPHPRRRCERRLHRTVLRARSHLGLPAGAGEVDQHLGPQIRPRAPRSGMGDLARRRRPAHGPDLRRQLPRREHANVRAQLLTARRPDRRAVLQPLAVGKEGYRKVHQAGYDNARYLAAEIANLGPFEMIYDGRGGIPALRLEAH